ncbi:hypothetical protein BCR44DRAFT_1424091 [Catenaria anguillulae PL171]|uniref:Uncharacterized protein n=1 Tax=Catenaria anguillulae PL171 TaxID=765915 RepID=A0A1Y2I255_9FUNG|nr:hypothetical protein BCR44DRAFT_1424091 [Catenaria anguillulae PL171]
MPGAPIVAPMGPIPTPASMAAAVSVGMLPLAVPPSDSQMRFEARRKRRARFERIYAEDQADVEGLAGRMRLLWSEYASSVLERHFIQSPQSLVVALFSTLATEHAAKAILNPTSRSGRRTPTKSATLAQLVTILRNSDVPRELLVPPVSTRPTSHDSVTVPRLLAQDPAKSHALASAQHLLTHHLAAACSQLFTKLQNMHCLPLLRSLLARPRDKVPAFLIACPPEVEEMAKAKLLGREFSRDSVHFDADDRPAHHQRTRSLASVGTAADADSAVGSSLELMLSLQSGIPLSILPDWFNDPRATPLDRLAALLRRELAASTSNVLESLMSAGLSHVRAQNLYDMVLRAVRLFAYMSHINPHLRWTWTEFQGGMFDDDSMEMVNVLPVSVSLHTPLKVLFSVSPGIVIDNPSEPRPQVLVPERVFAIPKSAPSSRPGTPRLSSPSPKMRAPSMLMPSPVPPMPSPRSRPKVTPLKLGDLAGTHADLQSRLWSGTPLPTPSPTRAMSRQMTPPGYNSIKSPTDSHMLVPPTPMFATSICHSPFMSSPHSTWGQMEPIVSPTLASATMRSRHSISETNIAGLVAPRAVRLSQLLPPNLDVTRPPAPLSASASPNPSSSHNASTFQSPQAPVPRTIASPAGGAPLGMSPAMASLLAPIVPAASPSSSFGISPMNGPRDLPLGGNNAPPNNTTLASARLLEAALMAADVVRARTPSASRANSVNVTPIVSPDRAQPPLPLTPFPALSQQQQQQPLPLLPFPADDGRPVGEQMRKWLSATESTLIGRQLSTLPRTNSVANVLHSSRIEVAQQEAKPKRKRKSATFLLNDDGSDAEQEHEYEEDLGQDDGEEGALAFRDQNAAQAAST